LAELNDELDQMHRKYCNSARKLVRFHEYGKNPKY